MFSNYMKVAYRTLVRNKSFSLINILGLAIGMPVCLLVILVLDGQRNLDQFHQNKDRVFRVITRATEKATGRVYDLASAPPLLSPVLKSERAEVEDAVRLHGFYGAAKYGEKLLSVEGFYAEQSYFRLFSFPLSAGNPQTALQEPYSAVISEDLKEKFFGGQNPLGRVLSCSFGDVVVTGVLQNPAPDQQSHLQREILISFSTLAAQRGKSLDAADPDNWNNHTTFYHYLLLADGKRAPAVEAGLPSLTNRFAREDSPYDYQFSLQPLTGIALGPELVNQIGRVMEGTVLYIFLAVAFVIMVPVIFNYVSLTVARSLKRSKEVGIRKVVGAQRQHVIGQVLFESVMVAMLALFPAVVLLDLLLPVFNNFQFTEYLSVDWRSDWRVYAFFLIFSVGTGILAGIIPAIVLSSIKPVWALKGLSRIRGFSGLTLRKVFLVIQFTLSLFFIVITTLFHQQFTYMLTANYGFDTEHIVGVDLQNVPYDLFRNELVRRPGILDVSAASDLIGRVNKTPNLSLQSRDRHEPIKAVNFFVSENYLENLNFTMLAGRNFSSKYTTDTVEAVILNETAARRLGFTDAAAAVGQVMTVGDNVRMQVIGVTKDFHYSRLQNSIDPVALRFAPARFSVAMVRVAPGEMTNVLAGIEGVWTALSVDLKPLQYLFLNDYILGAYNDMRDTTVFLTIIAGLAIFIACLGLLGMAIFSTETRVKEIGVRKVFGASAFNVVVLLSHDLVKLLAFAAVLVMPLLWAFIRFMFNETVAHRVELGIDIFLPGFLFVVLLAFVTIGSQTIKAANQNPVEALRYE